MLIVEKYLELRSKKQKDYIPVGSYLSIKGKFKEKLIINRNVSKTEFNHLYPSIIYQLINKNLYKNGNVVDFLKMYNSYISERTNSNRILVNTFYGLLNNEHSKYFDIMLSHRVKDVLSYYYDELLNKNENILYIDTDTIYHDGEIDLMVSQDNTKKIIDFVCFFGLKRVVEYNISSSSFTDKGVRNSKIYESIVDMIKVQIRDDKLNSLL